MTTMRAARAASFDFATAVLAEFMSPERRRERLIDDGEAVLAVLLAILFAHLLHAERAGWAAFSGYMAMRSRLGESLNRGSLRILGTVVGAALAWQAVDALGHATLLLAIGVSLVGAISSYGYSTSRRGYAWLFVGLTFSMVVVDALSQPLREVGHFARTRILEVVAGVAASLLVAVVSDRTIRAGAANPSRAAPPPVSADALWHRGAAVHGLMVAGALAVLPLLANVVGDNVLSQAAISIMAVMAIPLASLGDAPNLVSRRAFHRFAGCVSGAAVAALCLLVSHRSASTMTACLALGVMVGRHLENANKAHAYVGNQFSLIFIVTLVPDSYGALDWVPGIERLGGVLLGVAILTVLRCAVRGATAARRRVAGATPTI